jgi:hypothetical protein
MIKEDFPTSNEFLSFSSIQVFLKSALNPKKDKFI